MRVEIWSDVICPWCYIGKRRFEKALAAFPQRDRVEVVHRSFQLDPDAPRDETRLTVDMLSAKYGMTPERAAAMEREMERRAAEDGLEYHLDGGRVGNTADAHRLLRLARENGVQDAVVEAFYRAHFTDRRSLFDRDELVAVAVEAGLDGDAARAALESGAYAAEIAAEQREARELGATGVPFFVVDRRYGVAGAQPAEAFAEVLRRAWADARPSISLVGEDGDACADGACAVPERS
ncbi:DsbA family oxidoreductase [Actinomadura kijaniata]|uniref:Putative DsbA family dithiol-disulfide isomerase n=1 Tax=Actinomadura namibiensis TaxID=182080 RepID=A0A7W3QP38_ACTNM|nr:DsbA family oxidoreductase [Actinomadura namibiensis]MBA8954239.1 putative DsbA family dithiol-disulfide isomerase [Actinomadura namibiensis]